MSKTGTPDNGWHDPKKSRKPYTAPSAWKISRASNPHRMGRAKAIDSIDGFAVTDLVRDFGSPLFIFSERSLRGAVRSLKAAFEDAYPKVTIAWSYKTNYLNAVCRIFHQEGSIAEVVSGFEYEKARSNGVEGRDIVFNGPHKTEDELRRAVLEGALIQVDNRDEILALANIATELGVEIRVGLRVNIDTGTHAVWSKFGFSADNGDAARIIRWVAAHTPIKIVGLHCHIGTFMLDAGAYSVATKKMIELAGDVRGCGGRVEYLNLGGGFASHARLHGQYLPPEQASPQFGDYARAIGDTILECWPEGEDLPQLLLETGRALVDDAGYLATTVVAVKKRDNAGVAGAAEAYGKVPSGALAAYGKGGVASAVENRQSALVLDSGINILYTTAWYQPSLHPVSQRKSELRAATVFGCLCMNIDVIREEAWLPEMSKGDIIVAHPVGAYNVTQSMQFISYRPAVVLVGTDGTVHLIRRRETLDDVQGPELTPGRLDGGAAAGSSK